MGIEDICTSPTKNKPTGVLKVTESSNTNCSYQITKSPTSSHMEGNIQFVKTSLRVLQLSKGAYVYNCLHNVIISDNNDHVKGVLINKGEQFERLRPFSIQFQKTNATSAINVQLEYESKCFYFFSLIHM